MNTENINLKISSSYQILGVVRNAVKNYLEAEIVETKDIYKILSIVDELTTNVVEHAYEPNAIEKPLDILLKKEHDMVFVSIEDYGDGFKGEGNSKEEGGMGLNIVRGLADHFEIVKKDCGTKVEISKKIQGGNLNVN
jgi:serine/threonine-protein kinase RsbW